VLYNGWERWITITGVDIKIEDGSNSKQLWDHGVKVVHKLQRWGRSRMIKRHGNLKVCIHLIGDLVDSLDYHSGKLRKKCQMRVREKRKKKGKTLMGRMKRVHHCLREQKQAVAKLQLKIQGKERVPSLQ
jgi:hypothetical protein